MGHGLHPNDHSWHALGAAVELHWLLTVPSWAELNYHHGEPIPDIPMPSGSLLWSGHRGRTFSILRADREQEEQWQDRVVIDLQAETFEA
jgi:hypothetical protein